MQQALIVTGARGFLHLAHRSDRRVQLSVENFTDWDEAARWCVAHGIRSLLQFGEVEIPIRHWNLLCLMSPGAEHTTSELCDRLSSYFSSIQFRGRLPLEPTPERIRPSLAIMERRGFVKIVRPGVRGMEWAVKRAMDPKALQDSAARVDLASAA